MMLMPSTKPKATNSTRKPVPKQTGAAKVLNAPSLSEIPWLVHGFSTRVGGSSKSYGKPSLNLGFTKDDSRSAVEKNRATFLKKVGAPQWPTIEMKQVHSDVIHCVTALEEDRLVLAMESTIDDRGRAPRGFAHGLVGDGLVTNVPGILLAVKTADCMPVILVDKKKKAIGIFHAGWRGTLHRIVEKGVGEMHRWFGSKPRDLHAALGPSIRDCCYTVGEEVRDHFRSQFEYADELFREWQTYEDIHLKYPLLFLTMRAPGHSELPTQILLNLAEANRRQLMDAGVSQKNITVLPQCTASDTKTFFSHRAEHGKTGRLMSVVGIRKIG